MTDTKKATRLYGYPVEAGACLNRLKSILIDLKNMPQNEDKFPWLMYGAVELRYAIEGTIRSVSFGLTGKHLKGFVNASKTKRLAQILKDHDKKFFTKLHVCVLIAKHEKGRSVIEPDFKKIDTYRGKIGNFLHAKRLFETQEKFDAWASEFEACLVDGGHYMFQLFGNAPAGHFFDFCPNEKGKHLICQIHSGRMTESEAIEFIKSGSDQVP